jgi:hypothetical protein
MNISKVVCGVMALTLLADVALAEPNVQAQAHTSQVTEPVHTFSKHKPQVLADAQMDKVTAGGVKELGLAIVSAVIQSAEVIISVGKALTDGLNNSPDRCSIVHCL